LNFRGNYGAPNSYQLMISALLDGSSSPESIFSRNQIHPNESN